MATLTSATLRGLRSRAKMYEVTCSGLPGFVARILPSGKKVLLVRVRVDGRDRRVRIGVFGPDLSVEDARLRAIEILDGGAPEGRDDGQPARRMDHARAAPGTPVEARPRAPRRGAARGHGRGETAVIEVSPPVAEFRARAVDAVTFTELQRARGGRWHGDELPRLTIRQLSDRFLNEYVDVYLKPGTRSNYRQILADYILPAIGHLDFREVSRSDAQRLHISLRDRPSTANTALCVLGSLYSRIIKDWELADIRNPTSGVRRFKIRNVERFLTPEERQRLESVLQRGLRLPVARKGHIAPMAYFAIKLLALTGLRSSEIMGLTWPMIDWRHAVLNLPDTKTGQRSVPVSSQVIEVLREVHEFSGGPSRGYVIRSRTGRKLASINRTWERIRRLAGIPDVRIHDLRHSFASDALMGGVPLAVIGKMLGHRQLSTTQRYAHLADRVVREALESTASRITEAAQAAPEDLEPPASEFKPLTNTQWSRIAKLVQEGQSKRSRPLLRGVVNGIRWRLHHEETWHNIPPIYGRSTTCWRWYQRWSEDGTWAEIERRLG